MTIASALSFIKQGQADAALRNRLNRARSPRDMARVLAEFHLSFTPDQFEEACSLSLFKCQEADQAQALKAFRMWWLLLCRATGQTVTKEAS